jgi:outer membrane immunogenic protein
MNKFLYCSAACVISLAGLGAAAAANLPVKAPPLPVAAVYNWTGFYVGGNVGGSWSNSDVASYSIAGFPIPLTSANSHQTFNGALGGGQIGYNWQRDKFVFGVEADAAWRNTSASTQLAFPNGLDFTTFTTRQDAIATFRPRAGVAVNNWLFYVTGGAAVEEIEHSFVENRPSVASANRTISSDDTRWGWTVGAGVEAGFGRWSAGLEYLYVDFGRTTTLSAPAQVLGGVPFGTSVVSFNDSAQQILRVKLNYRFNGPVVAKY